MIVTAILVVLRDETPARTVPSEGRVRGDEKNNGRSWITERIDQGCR
jgi:hypothetical protein